MIAIHAPRCYVVFLLLFIVSISAISQDRFPVSSRFDQDAGPWAGIHLGFQTNGAPFDKRLSGLIHYEYRFKDSFGLLVSYQVWRTRFVIFDGVQTHELFTTFGSLMGAMKFRLPLGLFAPFVTSGIGSGVSLAPFLLFYSFGTKIYIHRKLHAALEIRRTTIQEDSFFMLLGFAMAL